MDPWLKAVQKKRGKTEDFHLFYVTMKITIKEIENGFYVP